MKYWKIIHRENLILKESVDCSSVKLILELLVLVCALLFECPTCTELVKQDYQLPEEVLKEIGVSLFEYEEYIPNETSFDKYQPDFYEPIGYEPTTIDIKILRRGVIGVRQIAYV